MFIISQTLTPIKIGERGHKNLEKRALSTDFPADSVGDFEVALSWKNS
jgi:hypothetical protein